MRRRTRQRRQLAESRWRPSVRGYNGPRACRCLECFGARILPENRGYARPGPHGRAFVRPPPSRFLARHGQRIRRSLGWGVLLLAGLAALAFAGDYAVLRYRIAAQKDPFGAVTVRPYYAVRLKSGKTEFIFQAPRQQTCVNSLFPHFGTAPCWYLQRHPERRIDI